jgi:hypothetical protein
VPIGRKLEQVGRLRQIRNGDATAAVLTSLIATSKRLSIDPFAYLRDIFERISTHPQNLIAELLPDQWRAAQQAAAIS